MSDLFRQYMLNASNEAERDQIRERLLADPSFHDEMREQENDWIDAYAAGRLPPNDRALLHAHLVDTGQLHRVAMAVALGRKAPASVFPYALAIAAIVLLCFGVFLAGERRGDGARHPLVAVALVPGTLRDGAAVQRVVRKPGHLLELQLFYQDTSPAGTCIVTIKNSAGDALDEAVGECGTEFHPYLLPDRLRAGRYRAELADGQRSLVHAYLFDVAE
jgi:hypothetical protein